MNNELQIEIDRIIQLNKLMGREVGNKDQIFLQAQLLVEEGIVELSDAIYRNDRMALRDAVADAFVVAVGGCYLTECETECSETIRVSDYLLYSSITSILAAESRPDASVPTWTDCAWAVNGFSLLKEINLAADLKAVNDSNLSKFCKTEQEVIDTINKYMLNHDLDCEDKETGDPEYPYAVFSTENKGNFKAGKLLKSINYKEPVFLPEAES